MQKTTLVHRCSFTCCSLSAGAFTATTATWLPCLRASTPQQQLCTRIEKHFSHSGKACKQALYIKTCEMLNSLGWFLSSPKPRDLKTPSEAAAALINIVLMESGRYWCVSGKVFSLQAFLQPELAFPMPVWQHGFAKEVFTVNWKAPFS